MEQQKFRAMKQSQWKSYLWLAMAAMFLLFSNGKWVIPLATWLVVGRRILESRYTPSK